MKLKTEAKPLASASARVRMAANTKTTLPILTSMVLKATGDKLTLTGNNLDVTIEIAVSAEVAAEGAIALPAQRFADAVKALEGNQSISISLGERNICEIKQGGRVLKLCGLPAEEAPEVPAFVPDEVVADLGKDELYKALKALTPFISADVTRFTICGVAVMPEGMMVAADGRKMRTWAGASIAREIIIPAATVAILMQLCQGEATTMRTSERMVEVTGKDWRLLSRVIEGNFPNYKAIIPDKKLMKHQLHFNRPALLKALNFSEIAATQQNAAVKISTDRGSALLLMNGADVGETSAEIEGSKSDLPLCSFDHRFLRQMILSMKEDEQTLMMQDELSAGFIVEENGCAVLMPMRVG